MTVRKLTLVIALLLIIAIYPALITTATAIADVMSTSWKTYPYFKNGLLVVNSTYASVGGQYIGWYYIPTSNTLNVTIKVVSFPSRGGNPGVVLYSANIGNQTNDGNRGFWALQVAFYNPIVAWHSPSSDWSSVLLSVAPNPNYPFTYTVIFTKNSAGNVTVSQVAINGTYYTVNVNTPFPWNEIGVVGIRGAINNLFYVSYFAVSTSTYTTIFVGTTTVTTTVTQTTTTTITNTQTTFTTLPAGVPINIQPSENPIEMARNTGLAPVLALVITLAIAGIVYKIGGKFAGAIAIIATSTALLLFDFMPVYVYIAVIIAIGVAFVIHQRGGDIA